MTGTPGSAHASIAGPPGAGTGSHIHIVLIAVMSGLFFGALDGTIVSTALPTIVGDLGGLSQAPWISVGFLLTQTIATPIVGKLSDIYGRKETFQATIVLFLVSSLLCGAAQSMTQLVAFRSLQGIGAGGLLTLPLAIVGDLLPPAERARYQGYTAGTFALAALVGPLLGGFIVDVTNWRWVFLINLPFGLVSMALVQRFLFIPREPTRRTVDVLGAVLLSVATGPLVVALLWSGRAWGWTAGGTLTLLAVSLVGLIVFVIVESRLEEPILTLDLFRNPVIRPTMIGGFVAGMAIYALNSYSPLFLQVVRGVSATGSGLMMLPTMVGVTTASIISGRIISRTGNYKPFPIMGTCTLLLGAYLLSTMSIHTSPLDLAARSAVTGLGMGQIGPSLTLIVQNAVPYRELGVATSGLSFIRSLGGVLGSAALGAVYSDRLETLIPRYVGADAMATVDVDALQGRPEVIRALDEPVRGEVIQAFVDSITTALRWAMPPLVLAAVAFVMVPRIPLRRTETKNAEPAALE